MSRNIRDYWYEVSRSNKKVFQIRQIWNSEVAKKPGGFSRNLEVFKIEESVSLSVWQNLEVLSETSRFHFECETLQKSRQGKPRGFSGNLEVFKISEKAFALWIQKPGGFDRNLEVFKTCERFVCFLDLETWRFLQNLEVFT